FTTRHLSFLSGISGNSCVDGKEQTFTATIFGNDQMGDVDNPYNIPNSSFFEDHDRVGDDIYSLHSIEENPCARNWQEEMDFWLAVSRCVAGHCTAVEVAGE